jgi:hypothetical protein
MCFKERLDAAWSALAGCALGKRLPASGRFSEKLTTSVEAKRAWIEPDHPALSIRRQCALLGLNRAS